jgi:hypothetical protein
VSVPLVDSSAPPRRETVASGCLPRFPSTRLIRVSGLRDRHARKVPSGGSAVRSRPPIAVTCSSRTADTSARTTTPPRSFLASGTCRSGPTSGASSTRTRTGCRTGSSPSPRTSTAISSRSRCATATKARSGSGTTRPRPTRTSPRPRRTSSTAPPTGQHSWPACNPSTPAHRPRSTHRPGAWATPATDVASRETRRPHE